MVIKKWIKLFFLISSIIYFSVFLVNYIIDPFGVFNSKFFEKEFQENERFIKVDFLEKNRNKFNGLMFGSSRIGTTPPSLIESYIPNSKFYNFTLSSANFYDYEKHLAYFIKEKYPIKYLYLQIDIENMIRYGAVESDYLRKPHPYVNNKSLFNYYLSYLGGFFPSNIIGKIRKNINDLNPTVSILETGNWYKPIKDKALAESCEEYIKSEPTFNTKYNRTIDYSQRNKNIEALKRIKKMTDINGISLIVFTTPHNKNMMDKFIIKDYFLFLRDIASITSYYDFSGYNSVTVNNCNYYEFSHYHKEISKLISAKIFNDQSIIIPSDFGHFVNKENIDLHIDMLKHQIESYLIKEN